MNQEAVRALVDLRTRQIQKTRIAFGNRVAAIERGSDQSAASLEIFKRWERRFEVMEKDVEADIKDLIGDYPIVEYACAVKGIGMMSVAQAIAMVDIRKADTVSALWRYSGYGQSPYWVDKDGKIMAPEAGYKWKKNKSGEKEKVHVVIEPEDDWKLVYLRSRPIKGWTLDYNSRLKVSCYNIAGSFLKSNSPYRKVYDEAREYYDMNRPDWTKMHKHRAATRKMIKMWLSHLWQVWRELEGLPTREAYVHEKLGHTKVRRPQEFGWPVVGKADK